ncbi:hypothetical protein JOL79_13775 [Microbispora sp. RL4-1S]|uniref:Mce-associated membrane protein n=1 Tax=Microbispora oryzae TaxID=2806554 RepID=A0A940WG40_9ACTN|nr:hypothetical protein [Microbispora oryzae]MBP2704885.1 hypothetical protein [Microbispora oryzae]
MADAARAPRSRSVPPTALLTALVLVLAGLAYWLNVQLADERALAADREAVVRAAAAHAVALLSVNHRTVDDDLKRALATATGQERADYEKNAPALRATTLEKKVVQTGVLRASALESLSADRRTAEVLIVADAEIHWEDGKKAAPEERFYRWRMKVTEAGGLWLVAAAERVP